MNFYPRLPLIVVRIIKALGLMFLCLVMSVSQGYSQLDSDGDGITDDIDLDDDNDGILDVDECFSCVQAILNGGFEDSPSGFQDVDDVPGWLTTDTQIEVWPDNYTLSGFTHYVYAGSQSVELQAHNPGTLYQEICIAPGSTLTWSCAHKARGTSDETAEVRIGASLASATVQATMTDNRDTWGTYSGTYTVPMGQNTTVFAFGAVIPTTGSLGNILDEVVITVTDLACGQDTDGDGITDDLDLDSDGDGCADAIEGGGSFTADDLNDDGSLDSEVDSDGVPIVTSGGQDTDLDVTDSATQSPDCDPCTDPTGLDTDGDGVNDVCDLDDDNDGMLDSEECATINVNYSVLNLANHFDLDDIPSLFDGDSGYSNDQDLRIHQSNVDGDNVIVFSFTSTLPAGSEFTLHFVNDDISGINSGQINNFVSNLVSEGFDDSWWDYDGDGSLTTADFDINGNGSFDLGSDYSPLGVAISFYDGDPGYPAGTGAGTLVYKDYSPIQIIDLVSYSHTIASPSSYDHIVIESNPDGSGKDPRLVEVEFEGQTNSGDLEITLEPDSDGDGIINCLDIDSDNDGCPDAMEADGVITYSDLAGDNSLGDAVDANGIPIIIGSGGQEDESSTDAAISNSECVAFFLPVELLTFDGYQNAFNIDLEWSTATETQSSHFDIQRSSDGQSFETIGTVGAAGYSQEVIDYYFVDRTPELGINYYRLRQVDTNGEFEILPMIAIEYELDAMAIRVFPNPINLGDRNSTLKLSGLEFGESFEVSIYNTAGTKIYGIELEADGPIHNFEIQNHIFKERGVHIVTLDSGNGRLVRKVVVQ
jgi:hypothetical protein